MYTEQRNNKRGVKKKRCETKIMSERRKLVKVYKLYKTKQLLNKDIIVRAIHVLMMIGSGITTTHVLLLMEDRRGALHHRVLLRRYRDRSHIRGINDWNGSS